MVNHSVFVNQNLNGFVMDLKTIWICFDVLMIYFLYLLSFGYLSF